MEQLDRIRLDEFEITRPSGAKVKPHAGQSVWVYGYGRSASETARAQARITGANDPVTRLDALCAFLAGEIVKWDIASPRTGEPYPDPSASAVADLPDDLVVFLTQRILGIETQGEGSGASGA